MDVIQAYEKIRNAEDDVEKIARNLNMDIRKIAVIKQYLFYEEYADENGVKEKFEPDFEIVKSWNRLAYEPENIQEHDRILIDHEIMEIALFLNGVPKGQAHNITNKKFNYHKAVLDYYERLKTQ